MMAQGSLNGRKIRGGLAEGEALVTRMGISFFGGVDPESGVVVERGHELEGQSIAGKVLVFPTGKGSTVGSYTIYRLKHSGAAPAAIINANCETITAVGCIIAEIPCVDQVDLSQLVSGMRLRVDGDGGRIEILDMARSDGQVVEATNRSGNPSTPVEVPPPLGGWEAPSFAHHTVTKRLPKIAIETLEGLQKDTGGKVPMEVTQALTALAEGMPDERVRTLYDRDAPDSRLWDEYTRPFLGKTWIGLPWFFAEMYFYRRVLEATGYYGTGWGRGRDPFTLSKRLGVEASLEGLLHLTSQAADLTMTFPDDPDTLPEHTGALPENPGALIQSLLLASLWGNQADLSMWAAGEGPASQKERQLQDNLIVDHSGRAVDIITTGLKRVDIVLDNSGPELMADLVLVDTLLNSELCSRVVLHAKAHPTFVSDAIREDIVSAIDYLSKSIHPRLQNMGDRLARHVAAGRLYVIPGEGRESFYWQSFYWHSPLAFWDRPAEIDEMLAGSDLVVFKGDANFRRLLGDRHWAHTTGFKRITNLKPLNAPVLALRVCKSEVVSGLESGQSEALFKRDPAWMTDGRWGMAILAE